eukprot:TRINITY_DN26464_c0_g1_i1.p2 TRINITY_DN26464_c0_g1~~TRINITY_DN26464_c0_g1_i1.p2  ORF type:complete len:105 (+),score=27.15 TRINITY_DN26464_c0_g1_i1:115-429(+)
MLRSLVGSEMCIRDRNCAQRLGQAREHMVLTAKRVRRASGVKDWRVARLEKLISSEAKNRWQSDPWLEQAFGSLVVQARSIQEQLMVQPGQPLQRSADPSTEQH